MASIKLSLNIDDADSEVRANHPAKITSGTLIFITYINWMITSAIYLGRLMENILRTKLNTEAASLTPLCQDKNFFILKLHTAFTQYSTSTDLLINIVGNIYHGNIY